RLIAFLALFILSIGALAACGSDDDEGATNENGNKEIDELTIGFVPSKDPDDIITATEPLKDLLKDEMKNEGYDIDKVDISAGTTDVGLIPGGTFVLYDDGAEVILTATRAGLNNDSDEAKDWNENKPTKTSDEQATYYRAIFIAGPSEKGQELAEKVNDGDEL